MPGYNGMAESWSRLSPALDRLAAATSTAESGSTSGHPSPSQVCEIASPSKRKRDNLKRRLDIATQPTMALKQCSMCDRTFTKLEHVKRHERSRTPS